MTRQLRAAYVGDRLLTSQDVAETLGVSLRTVARLAASGDLPRVRIGRAVRFRACDVAGIVAGALQDDERPVSQPGAVTTSARQGGGHDAGYSES